MAKTFAVRTRLGKDAQTGDSWEGGWGIVVVIAAHLSLAIQVGLLRSGGVLYLSWKEDFDTSDKDTAAVNSVMTSMMHFSGLPAGILTERFGCRITGMVGGGLSSVGLLCSYWVTHIHHFYITAFFTGFGIGICYNSSVVVVALYFKRKYKIAHAVAFSGIGTGIMALPPLVQLLLKSYGWRGAFLISAAIAANSVALGAFFRPIRDSQKHNRTSGVHIQNVAVDETWNAPSILDDDINSDKHMCCEDDRLELQFSQEQIKGTHNTQPVFDPVSLEPKNSNFTVKFLQRLSVALGFQLFLKSYRLALLSAIQLQYCIAYMGFVVYLVPRAQSVGVSPPSAAILLSMFGIGSLLGRLGSGWLVSWKVSPEHVTALSLVLAGASVFTLSFKSFYLFATASALHGFASGLFFSVGVILSRSFVGVRNLAIGFGIGQILVGTGCVIGPILAGWILDLTGESYHTVFYVLGALCFICAVQVLLLPLLRRVEPGIDIGPTDV